MPDAGPVGVRHAAEGHRPARACPTSSTRSPPRRCARRSPPPDQARSRTRWRTKVKGSVVQDPGIAPSCSRQIDGSGFVFAPGRVMTNAHVLAGVAHPKVYAEGREYPRTPVYIDEETDVAVLAVPGLPEVPLQFAPTAAGTGADTIIMGYPGRRPPLHRPRAGARPRRDQRARLPRQPHRRSATSTRCTARCGPGNSGGPLFDRGQGARRRLRLGRSTTRAPGTPSPPSRWRRPRRPAATATRERSPRAPASSTASADCARRRDAPRLTTSGASSWGKWPTPGRSAATRRSRRRSGRSPARCSGSTHGSRRAVQLQRRRGDRGGHPPGVAQPVGPQLRAERPSGSTPSRRRRPAGCGRPTGSAPPPARSRRSAPGRARPAAQQLGDRVVVGAGQPALGQPGELEAQRVRRNARRWRRVGERRRAAAAGAPSTARRAAARCAGAARPWSSRAGRPSRARRRRRRARPARGPAPRRRPPAVGQVVAAGRLVAGAVAAQVGRDRAEAGVGQRGQLVPPGPPELREPVQQQHQRARRRPRRRAGARRWP